MSIKNLDNLDEAINSINSGLTPQIIVTTNGDSVYAIKGSERVDGVKSGDKFILNVSTGTWTVYVVHGSESKSTSVNVANIARYDIDIQFIITFADCTPAEFLQIAQGLQAGTISVSDLSGWDVGATKTVHLNAFNTYSSSTSSTTRQAAQDATLVILHKKSGDSCAGKQFSNGSVPSFIIGFKDNVCISHWNTEDNTYQNSLCWKVENNIYNALPTEYKQAFGKQFKAITGIWASTTGSQSTATYNRNMCSPAEAEVFGNLGDKCIAKESKAIGNANQFDYYKTQANRKHTKYKSYWWERSPCGDTNMGSGLACAVSSDGSPNSYGVVANALGLAPFGCI